MSGALVYDPRRPDFQERALEITRTLRYEMPRHALTHRVLREVELHGTRIPESAPVRFTPAG